MLLRNLIVEVLGIDKEAHDYLRNEQEEHHVEAEDWDEEERVHDQDAGPPEQYVADVGNRELALLAFQMSALYGLLFLLRLIDLVPLRCSEIDDLHVGPDHEIHSGWEEKNADAY